jgi:hypothetical protein
MQNNIKKNLSIHQKSIIFSIIIIYYISHFNILEVPSADYIGNFRSFVISFMESGYLHVSNKLLPAYPTLLGIVTLLSGEYANDSIYFNALILNFLLFPVFTYFVYNIFIKQIGKEYAITSTILLTLNPFCLYMAINAELEMFYASMLSLTFYLFIYNKKGAMFTTPIISLIKWDSVFIFFSFLWTRYRQSKKFFQTIIITGITGIPFALWFLLKIVINSSDNNYVREIQSRGPNIYRFLLDVYLVTTGFIQWLTVDIYENFVLSLDTILILILLIPFALIISLSLLRGFYLWVIRRYESTTSILIFLAGYFLIHMIYQNTKSRYVLPILFLLSIPMLIGLIDIINFCVRRLKNSKKLKYLKFLLFSITAMAVIILAVRSYHLQLVFGGITVYLIHYFSKNSGIEKKIFSQIASILVLLNLISTPPLLNHYSTRRVEFKRAAQYLNVNAPIGSKVLISENNIPNYYSNKAIKYSQTSNLASTTVEELIDEIQKKNFDYIYIDHFYIDRLKRNDKNAIDKNAELLKELKDIAPSHSLFTLVYKIDVNEKITGYLYKIN